MELQKWTWAAASPEFITPPAERCEPMKLLLATDGSPCSDAVVREVYARPWPPGTKVTVLAVAHIPFPLEVGETCDMGRVVKELAPRVAERAAELLREHAPELLVEHKLAVDLPKRAIIDEAEHSMPDLIFVGSHGHGAMHRFLMGSVSHAVLLHAPCSVEVVRAPRPRQDKTTPMKVLLATDGSPCSDGVVREVRSRPWPAGSEIKVVTAIDTSISGDPYWTDVMLAELIDQQRREAPLLVGRAAEALRSRAGGPKVTTEVLHGHPSAAVIEHAERWEADLIFVGSHGYKAVSRMLLGSVSNAVALHAPCSVEIVRCRPSRAEM
jgi:nucleotide-binding universal stress UspA family protein